jgi:hypothetical protein
MSFMKLNHWSKTALWVVQLTMEKHNFFVKWDKNEIIER